MNVKVLGCLFGRAHCCSRGLLNGLRNHSSNQTPENTGFSPATSSKYDWIGPPDRLSNLRPIIYYIPENESQLEMKLRHLRQETEDWNHEFWKRQNITFTKEKEKYTESQIKAKGLPETDEKGRKPTLTSEEMAAFYKEFLDKNFKTHASYNKEWYRRNFTITFLMAKVTMQNAWRTLTGQARSKS